MDNPDYHRSFAQFPGRASKPPLRPGGLPRQGELVFRTLTAHRMESGKLVTITVFEKSDQNFQAYATPFERAWSKAAAWGNALDPVVDDKLTVVGHAGRISAAHILIPKHLASESDVNLPDHMLREGIPFFVGSQPPDSAWVPYLRVASGEGAALNVVTAIDGRVLMASGIRPTGAGAIAEDFSILDAICIVKGILSAAGATGRYLVRGLARKSAAGKTAAFSGPTHELAQLASRAAAPRTLARSNKFIPETGMPINHFRAFQEAAKEANAIAVVRNTNNASVKLIEAGCPGKPMFFKFHTSDSTGIVMAKTPQDVVKAWAHDHFVVGDDLIARRTIVRQGRRVNDQIDLRNAFWKVEKGQVIDPVLKKPLVGDYDLMGVIDPSATGRNIALAATKEGGAVQNVTSPIVKKFSDAVNGKLDRPRVLHGAQDQFAGFRKGATAFHPDGTVTYLPDEAAVKQFYDSIGRQTIKGSYPKPSGPPPADELALRRAARK